MALTKIPNNLITADAIDGTLIADDAINSEHIADGSIDLAHMSVNSIDSDQYIDGSIDTAHIGADQITSALIADDQIDSEHIVDGSIDLAHMSVNSIDSDQYVDGSIDLVHMSANSIDSDQYVDGSIDTAHIAADQITSALIADDQIDSEHIVDGSIDTAHIAADQITSALIADDAIDSEHYAAGSIDLEHMSSQSVDEDNLYISNAGSNGQFLSKQSGNSGGLTWADAGGTISAVANGANNRITTFSSSDALNGEANLTFDGSTLAVTGAIEASGNITGGMSLYTTRDQVAGALTAGYDLGYLYFGGRDSDSGWHRTAAAIRADVAGTWTSSSCATELQFTTTAEGSTDSTQRMVIDKDGNVGIGTTSPYRDLDVMNAATGQTWIRLGSDYSNGQTVGLEFVAGGNGPTGSGFVQASQYLVGSGSSSSQVMNFKLVDNSSIKLWLNNGGFNGTHASTSDIALKENVADLADGTTMIKALRPRTFDWKEDMEHAGVGTGQTGFIAQEVEAVSDKLINGEEGTKGIYTMGLLTLAIKTIQELEARITALEG